MKKKGSLLARFWMMMTIWNTKILEQSQLSIPGSNFVWHFLFFYFFAFSREMFHLKSSHTCLPTEKSESGGAHTLITGKPKASCPSSSVFHNYRSLAIFGMCFQSLLLLTSLHCTALHCAMLPQFNWAKSASWTETAHISAMAIKW